MIYPKTVFILLVIYQAKHFLADYPLQGRFMLGKFKKFPDFIIPLMAHSLIHGLFTYLIALMYRPDLAIGLGAFDAGMHFLIDRVKASPSMLGRFKALNSATYMQALNMSMGLSIIDGKPMPDRTDEKTMRVYKKIGKDDLKSNTYFWWSLGLDQMAHHLTHYAIIWILL
jgi:hypothetical protein